MTPISWILVVVILSGAAAAGTPKRGSRDAEDAVLAVLTSFEGTALRDLSLTDRVFRVGYGAFNGETSLSNGTLESGSSSKVMDLSPASDDAFRAHVTAANLTLRYSANVTFNKRSERAAMNIYIDTFGVTVTLASPSHDKLGVVSVDAEQMADMKVVFQGLKNFAAQADLLSLLFLSAFRFDIEDELAAVIEDIFQELVYLHDANNP